MSNKASNLSMEVDKEDDKDIVDLRSYLSTPLNRVNCPLTVNNNMSFHWADYSLTCELYMDLIRKDTRVSSAHHTIVKNMDKLKTIPLWVKTIDGVSTLSLYDIYDALATKGNVSRLYVNKAGKMVVSFHGPGGPFEVLSPSECINKERFTELIFSNLLNGKLPVRDFRVRCNGKALVYYDLCFNKNTTINIEQITTDGILFSTSERDLREKILFSKEIKVLINLNLFHEVLKKSLTDVRNSFSEYTMNLFYTRDSRDAFHIQPKNLKFYQSYDYDLTGKQYMYCHYSNIKGQNDSLENILREFIEQLRSQLKEEIFSKVA
jgi:hypothetical protein